MSGHGDDNLYAINPDGTQKWAFTTGYSIISSPSLGADGTIYVGSTDDKLYAVNPDGTQKWAFATGNQISDSSPAIGADGTIYIGSLDDNLYAVNPDGTQKWTFPTGNSIYSSPAIGADGTIYIGSDDGKLYAITNGSTPLTAVSFTTSPTSPQPINTSITLTATATGGTSPIQFQFWLYSASSQTWSKLQALSTTNTCTWTPTMAGYYYLTVSAQDATGTQASNASWYSVSGPPLTAVNLNASPISPQAVNTPITLTATATGGTDVSYQFWAYAAATQSWSQLPASSSSCNWTPATAGWYYIPVTAQDGVSGTVMSNAAWYGVSGLTGVTLSTAPTSPQAVNTGITLTLNATGGTQVLYGYWLYSATAGTWTQLQGFSSVNSLTWTPTTAGSYLISGAAEDALTGEVFSASAWYLISSGTPLTAVALTASQPSPQPVNTALTLTATATGGSSLTYQFWCYSVTTGAWNQLQAFTPANTVSWTPSAPGLYLLSTTAQDGSSGQQKSASLWYTVSGPPLTAVSLAEMPVSPQSVNTTVTLTATASGGTAVQYQFWAYSATTQSWSQLQALSTSSTCTWTPATAGWYYLSVTALDATGATASTSAWYGVSSLLSATLTTSKASPQPANTPITLTLSATGGSNLQYQYWIYNATTQTWSQLQGFSTSPSYSWTPTAAGDYYISGSVLDGLVGMEVTASTWFTIQ